MRVSDHELDMPSEEQRARDRDLIAALGEHESIGERYSRTGEIPIAARYDPSVAPSPGAAMQRDPTPVKPIPSPPRAVGRMIVRALIALAAVMVLYYLVTLWQVWSTGRSDEARQVDAIVVLGAAQYNGTPSPQLAARLDHVVELWGHDLAPQVVVTGGKQPGDQFTEAQASATYLIERGVPESAIVLEDTSTTTYESFEGVRDLVSATVESVLIVTDPYHALRSELIAEDAGFDAYVSPTDTSVVTGATERRREIFEAAGVAVGRIIGFDRLSGLTD